MPRVVTYLILLAALVAGAYFSGRWTQREADMREREVAIVEAVAAARAQERAIAEEQRAIINEALKKAETDAAAAKRAEGAAQSVADAARAAAVRAARMCAQSGHTGAGATPTAPEGGYATGSVILEVFGRVLSECSGEFAEVAARADECRTAGLACQRAYNAARDALVGR